MKIHPIKSKLSLVAAFLIGAVSLGPAATIWNATDEFSVTNGNPNDVWTYGWMDSGFTTFTTYTQTRETSSDPAWYDPGIDSWIWLNETGSTSFGVPDGWLSLSPGNGGQATVLRWTAPEGTEGLVQVTGEFLPGDPGSENLAIFLGSTKTPESTLWSGTDSGSFNFNVDISSGDILNFTIYGPYNFGNTPISAAIQAVPEPSATILLIGAGTFALVFARRRFRIK